VVKGKNNPTAKLGFLKDREEESVCLGRGGSSKEGKRKMRKSLRAVRRIGLRGTTNEVKERWTP